jgi:hypothetical protein
MIVMAQVKYVTKVVDREKSGMAAGIAQVSMLPQHCSKAPACVRTLSGGKERRSLERYLSVVLPLVIPQQVIPLEFIKYEALPQYAVLEEVPPEIYHIGGYLGV